MNEIDGKKIIQSAKNIKMGIGERDRVRNFLLSEIEKSEIDRTNHQKSLLWQSLELFSFARAPRFAAIALLVLLVGGGTVMAAENSLPGDSLYPVKVNFGERVAGAFYLGEEAKAEREAELVEKRIKEIHKIADQGKNSTAQAQAETQLGKQLDRLQQRLARLEAGGDIDTAVEISSRAEASLGAGADTLLALENRTRISEEMEAMIREKQQNASQSRAGIEERAVLSVNIEISARRAYNNALNQISETETFISRLGRGMENLVFGARERLEVAGRLLAEGEAHLEAGEYREAYKIFNEAVRISQGTKFALENRMEGSGRPVAINQVPAEDRDSVGSSEISGRPVVLDEGDSRIITEEKEKDTPAGPEPSPTVAPLDYSKVKYSIESGLHSNLDGGNAVLVFSETLEISNTSWLRLEFADYNLGNASFITITSLEDGTSQTLNTETLKQWQGTSAFFNGNRLKLELFVALGDEGIFFEVQEIWVEGKQDKQSGQKPNSDNGKEIELKPDLNLEARTGGQSGLRLNF